MKIKILVKTNAKEEKIEKISEAEFRICVKKPAHDNLANNQIVKILSDYFERPKSSVRLTRGQKSKIKIFEIS